MSRSTARTAARTTADKDSLLAKCQEITTSSLQGVAFWAAVLMPAVYIAALYDGIGGQRMTLFLGLLVANVVCFVIGHDYSP